MTSLPEPPHPSDGSDPVVGLLARIAADRGLDFEPTPGTVGAEMPALRHAVQDAMTRLTDPQHRRWLAAALAAWSHHVQADALTDPDPEPDPEIGPVGSGGRAGVGAVSCRHRIRLRCVVRRRGSGSEFR